MTTAASEQSFLVNDSASCCAMSERGTKRAALSADSALDALREKVIAQLALISDQTSDEIKAAIAAQPEGGVLDLGLTSAQGISFKGWVFKQLEAECTTFQLLKQPFKLVVETIDTAQREGVGAKIPDLPTPQ